MYVHKVRETQPHWLTSTHTGVHVHTHPLTHPHSRSIGVGNRLDLVLLNLVQQRGEDSPRLSQLISTYKVGLLASKHVQDEPLVGIRQVEVLVASLVGEVQFTLHRLE